MRRSHRLQTWVASALVAAVVVTSCGSDSPGDSATTTPTASTSATTTELDTEPEQEPDPVNDQPASSEPTPSEPRPTQPLPTTSSDIAPDRVDANCRRLADFDDDEASEWFVVNDGVMGGRSNGAIDVTDSVMRFTGGVVTAGGGFTSVRLRLDGTELAGSTGVELRVRADARTYGLTLEDDAQAGRRAVSHRADLDIGQPDGTDGWTTVAIAYGDLRPSVFGQPVEAPPFNPETAREFGIIIADGRDGDFALEVDWIDACR